MIKLKCFCGSKTGLLKNEAKEFPLVVNFLAQILPNHYIKACVSKYKPCQLASQSRGNSKPNSSLQPGYSKNSGSL